MNDVINLYKFDWEFDTIYSTLINFYFIFIKFYLLFISNCCFVKISGVLSKAESENLLVYTLKSLPAETLRGFLPSGWSPSVDERYIKDHPREIYKKVKEHHKVDLLLGSNDHEGALYTIGNYYSL